MDPLLQEQGAVANALFDKGMFIEALEKYRLLAEAGSVEAQMRLGWMYQTGRGVKVNLDEARQWYLKAAEGKSPEARFYLGRLYRQERQYQEAMSWFRQSAMQNYLPSIYQLGVMYELGEGVERDKEQAYKYYEQAAKMGHLRAQRDMGLLMIKGNRGFKQIPQGILTLARIPYSAISLALKDPQSDRIRW